MAIRKLCWVISSFFSSANDYKFPLFEVILYDPKEPEGFNFIRNKIFTTQQEAFDFLNEHREDK